MISLVSYFRQQFSEVRDIFSAHRILRHAALCGFLLSAITTHTVYAADNVDATTNSSVAPAMDIQAPGETDRPESVIAKPKYRGTSSHHGRHRHAEKKVVQVAPAAAPVPEWYADHDRAVELARAGNTKQALAILGPLYRYHKDDLGVTRDYIAILGWDGGHDAKVVELYQTLPDPDQPDYVLQEVGRAYRNIHKPHQALAVYQIGLRHSPDDVGFIVGAMHSLAEDGYVEKSLAVADADIRYHDGGRIPVLLAAAEIADQYDLYKSLHYYEAVIRKEPNNKDALRGYIRAAGRMGSPQLAVKIAKEHPGIISASELRHLEGDEAAAMVRYGMAEPSTPDQRFVATDEAIARLNSLIAEWSTQGPDAEKDIERARYDRMLAFYNRGMYQDVVNEYNSMRKQGIQIPEYALGTVGDAYLALKEPEKARDLYLQVLKVDPHNYDVRRQLFYAYVECDQYSKAFKTVDALVQDEPEYVADKDKQMVPNPRHVAAQLMAGAGRLYAGEVSEGDKMIMPIVTAAPNVPANREALGNLYMAHGWPRHALEQYQIGNALPGGPTIGNQIGMAEANLALQNFRAAEDQTQSLLRQYPDNTQVQRLAREVDVHNMAELRVTAGYAFEPMTTQNVNGGEGYGIDTVIYSPPINDNWRIFAGEYFTHQKEPNAEGSISFSRTAAGGEYRNGPLTTSASLTYNHYHESERVGVAGDVSYSINDKWTVAGGGESISRDTPLRAMNSGVTAGEATAHAVWRNDEEQELRFGGNIMPFSDGNVRTGLDASYAQRAFTTPHIQFDGLADVGESQNTADSNRYYYNPSRDFIALVGARATQVLYERYYTIWQHSLRVEPGVYFEQHYGDSAALRMRYEQRVFFNQTFEAGLGVNFSRQAYDGTPENDVGLTLDLVDRF